MGLKERFLVPAVPRLQVCRAKRDPEPLPVKVTVRPQVRSLEFLILD